MAYITFIARDKYVASHHLEGDSVTLGRSFDADIFIPDVFVSRRHCVFEKSNKGWMIIDAESTNGIYFKGTRVKRRVLHHEDLVELGSIAFVFDEGEMEAAGASTRTPYGSGARVAELIDTLYAGESRPADYVRKKGRKPKWSKRGGGVALEEVEEQEACARVLKEDDAGEWTELDMEWQIASTEVELPPAAKFLLYGPAAFTGTEDGIAGLLPNNVDVLARSGNGASRLPASGAPGSFRAAAAHGAPAIGALAGAMNEGNGASPSGAAMPSGAGGFGGHNPWSQAGPGGSTPAAAEKLRKIRKPEKAKKDVDLSSLREKLDATFEDLLFRIRANPLVSSGVGAALVLVVVGWLFIANRPHHAPPIDFNNMTDKQRLDYQAASAN